MNSRSTVTLAALAAGIFALIYFFERPFRAQRSALPERRIFPRLNPAEIFVLQIRPSNQLIRVERTNAVWQLTDPLSYPAEGRRVDQLLAALSQLAWQTHITAEELKDRPNAMEEFGLASPQFSVNAEQKDLRIHLLVGRKIAGEDQVYLQVVGGDGLYLVSGEFLKFLPRSANDWRDTALVKLGGISRDTVHVRSGPRSFDLAFNPTNHLWRMIKPIDSRADNPKIEELLRKLQLTRIEQFISDDPRMDAETFGFQSPELEVSFLQGTNLVAGIQIGRSPTNLPTRAFARRLNENHVFLVARESTDAWRAAPDDFRDRHLLGGAPDEIELIEARGAEEFSVRRAGTNAWRILPPFDFPADQDLMHNFLTNLTGMETELEKAVVTDFGSYGLTNPLVEYRLQSTARSPASTNLDLARLSFGTNGGKIFARRSDETMVYLLKPEAFARLPMGAWQLRDRRIFDFESSNVVAITVQQKGAVRDFRRDSKGDWILAGPGFINPFRVEEGLYRLGHLRAVFWSGRGDQNLEPFGFREVDHEIILQLQKNGKMEKISLNFGKPSAYVHPYASTVLDGQRVVFEFPIDLFYNFIREDFSIPAATANH